MRVYGYLQYVRASEEYVDFLESIRDFAEAAQQLAACVNDDFVTDGHSKHQLWMRLCDMCAQHPERMSDTLQGERAVGSARARPALTRVRYRWTPLFARSSRFTDEVGRLWCKLAEYYTRLGQFERVRDVYEAVNSVVTVHDFSTVFDAYAQFEESVLSAKCNWSMTTRRRRRRRWRGPVRGG